MSGPAPPIVPRRSRAWIGWVVLVIVGGLVASSFLLTSGPTAAKQRKGPGRIAAVTAVAIVQGPITQRGRYPGELVADSADVAAFYAGRLLDVKVRIGDTVEAGVVIAELDPVDAREQIAQARAQAKAASAERHRATVEHQAAVAEANRLEPLARDQLISALEIDRQRAKAGALAASVETAAAREAEATARIALLGKRVIESVVRAPFAGRVAARYVDPGAIVAAGARLVRIVQMAPLRVRFEVPEHDVAQLTVGTRLAIETKAAVDPAATVQATLTGIASEVSRDRRVAQVEGLIDQPPPGWLPGMYAEAVVELRTIEQALLVPAAAVLSRMEPNGAVVTGVFVASGEVARWVVVREVTRDGDRVAIEGEVVAGASVLIAGHVDLTDGSKIKPDRTTLPPTAQPAAPSPAAPAPSTAPAGAPVPPRAPGPS